jgi:Domain of unknown function (DUF4926)
MRNLACKKGADLPAEKLTIVDVGTVANVYHDGAAFEAEFSTLTGETVAVVSLEKTQLWAVDHREVTHARRVAVSARSQRLLHA